MLDKYREAFATLPTDHALHLASSLGIAESDETELSGLDLFERCDEAGLDQASVLLAVTSDRSPLAYAIAAHLMGKPIRQCALGESGLDPMKPATPFRKSSAPSSPRPPKSDPRIVASVAPNPKRAGSASYGRYECWRAGESVSDAMARGLTAADVAHDVKKGFVVLEEAK